MKKLNKIIAFLLALTLLLFTVSGCAKENDDVGNVGGNSDNDKIKDTAADTEEETQVVAERVDMTGMKANAEGDFVYSESLGTAVGIMITDYIGSSDIVIVPDTIEGKPVVVIELQGESGNPRQNIRAIQIPAGISSVLMNYCEKLTTVEIINGGEYPATLKMDFSNCPDLTYINIPDGVTDIGSGGWGFNLENCSSLLSVELPDSVTSIYDRAFCGCKSLKEIIIPDSVTGRLGNEAFRNCSSLESIVLPSGVSNIEQQAFKDCHALKSVNIPEACYNIGRQAFSGCAIESITIPASVQVIGQDAFSGNSLKEVVIEDGEDELTLVGGCFCSYELARAVIPARVTEIRDNVFPNYSNRNDRQNDYLVIVCPAGSVAETYANEHGYTVKN